MDVAFSRSPMRLQLKQIIIGRAARHRTSPPQFSIFRLYATAGAQLTTPPHASSQQSAVKQWEGLAGWRSSGFDSRLIWGPKGPEPPAPSDFDHQSPTHITLAECGRQVLLTPDPLEKARLTHLAWRTFLETNTDNASIGRAEAPDEPSRPALPELVPARQIPTMKQTTLPLNVYMLHNLAHVELNAIDLAWDTVVRFSHLGLPRQFYADFARVADDESRHLAWCIQRLRELNYDYGCMPAHNLLWEGCQLSSDDVCHRLAIVPMSQEARGLDAGGRLADRLVGWGDNRSAAIVARITEEESAHVAVGVTWFNTMCLALECDPGDAFRTTLNTLCPDLLKAPFNHEKRQEVGLQRDWYDKSMWPQEYIDSSTASETVVLGGMVSREAGNDEALERLRQRLGAMVKSELENSNR